MFTYVTAKTHSSLGASLYVRRVAGIQHLQLNETASTSINVTNVRFSLAPVFFHLNEFVTAGQTLPVTKSQSFTWMTLYGLSLCGSFPGGDMLEKRSESRGGNDCFFSDRCESNVCVDESILTKNFRTYVVVLA